MKKSIGLVIAIALLFLGAYRTGADEGVPGTGKEAKKLQNEDVKGKQVSAPAAKLKDTGTPLTLQGSIIDNLCASGHAKDLASFVPGHSKECALMPACAASGYSFYADGRLYKFTVDSGSKVLGFLKKEGSVLTVEVTGRLADGALQLLSIRQKAPVKPGSRPPKTAVKNEGTDNHGTAPDSAKQEKKKAK